ncbi:hypothetical protein, partial [Streptomyces tendae]
LSAGQSASRPTCNHSEHVQLPPEVPAEREQERRRKGKEVHQRFGTVRNYTGPCQSGNPDDGENERDQET